MLLTCCLSVYTVLLVTGAPDMKEGQNVEMIGCFVDESFYGMSLKALII